MGSELLDSRMEGSQVCWPTCGGGAT